MPIDRKALTREYRETPRTCGIAVVRNAANGKVLLLAGKDIPALINRTRSALRFGGHSNKVLQGEWKEFGADQFTFEIVDTIAPPADTPDADLTDDLRALEAMWMEKLAPYEPAGYHRAPKAKT